jgi:UPF0716 family protein affecting phage T7 exclusion
MRAPKTLAKKKDGESSDDFSPGRVVGALVMALALAPVPLWYLKIGPELGVWELLGLVGGLGIIGAGLFHRRGADLLDEIVERTVGS